MHDRKRGVRGAAVLLAIIVVYGLTLSGYHARPGEAEAQIVSAGGRAQQIETFMIDPTSFSLSTNQSAIVEVSDQATTYTLQSDGDVTFELSGGTARSIDLNPGDMVIERPFAGTVTVIRDR